MAAGAMVVAAMEVEEMDLAVLPEEENSPFYTHTSSV